MCGIIGMFNYENALGYVLNGLKAIENRGKDGFGVFFDSNIVYDKTLDGLKESVSKYSIKNVKNALGHNLHSVVNYVFQPIVSKDKKSALAINGEIYNWKELNKKYSFNAKNDSELVFFLLQKKGINAIAEILDELDGVFAFAYLHNNFVVVARDIIGVKPMWFSLNKGFAFSSEKKALLRHNVEVDELNPRIILKYNIKEDKAELINRKFFDIFPEHKESYDAIVKNITQLGIKAIKKRIPDNDFGILFSGGIDSSFIAFVCKSLGLKFKCYTAALDSENEAEDLKYAKKAAKALNLELKYKLLALDDVESYLKKVVPLIEDTNVVKVEVALTFFVACELAKKDNIKVIFSGLGSEEIFAGYERHKKSYNINEECLSGLRKMYERDLYRDDVVAMNNNIELRLPFLDKELVDYALKIPGKYKIMENNGRIYGKMPLRDSAKAMGIKKWIAERPKKAAQYGSKFDKAIIKLAKKNSFKLRSEYLRRFYKPFNLKLAALVSGGKDSFYAMHIMQKQNYAISCFVAVKSKNKSSFMFHTPNIDIVKLQAKACNIPLIFKETEGNKEEELLDLKNALAEAKQKYGIDGVCSGAIFSNYQRKRIDRICDELGLKVFSPLWHMSQELEMRNLVDEGFVFIISSIAAFGMSKEWLGKKINNKDIDKLVEISKKVKINVAGEGGEFESLVLDGPMFNKRICIEKAHIEMENEFTGIYVVDKAVLCDKY